MTGRVKAPIRVTVTKAARKRRTHYAPTLKTVGHRGGHPAACGATALNLLVTSYPAFVTCVKCQPIAEAAQ